MKLLSLSCLMLTAVSLAASEPEIQAIIASARATVGAEAALNGLVTLQIDGAIESADPKLPGARIRRIARKPCSQRLEVHVDDIIETTLLEGQSGCIIRSNPNSPAEHPELRRMTTEEIRRMAFNTRQLFSMYSEDSGNGETVSYEGIEQRRGLQCHKLTYSYPNGVSTIRYFSVDGKQLVSTITDKGVESVEIGSQTVKGIRFPERIEYYQEGKLLHTLVLETIEVNKPLRVGIFTLPVVRETK